ncbi:MAG: DndE family protein [Candidatus Electronema sp. VV]
MGFNFKVSSEAGEFLESACHRVSARNPGVLGRAALFLALGRGLPKNFSVADSQGKEFQEDTIVGDELGPMVRAAINFRCGETVEESKYRRLFKLHVEYGCKMMRELWEECKADQTIFIAALLKECRIDEQQIFKTAIPAPQNVVRKPVSLSIIKESAPWVLNSAGANGLAVISGRPGSGKSQLILDMLAQAAQQGVRFLFFDLKGELEDDIENMRQSETRNKFLAETGAKYNRLISSSLPVNPLCKGRSSTEDAQISTEIAGLIRSFAPQLSASQEKAIRDAFDAVELPDFLTLAEELESQGVTGEGFSVIEKLVRFNIFSDAKNAVSADEWLSQSQVIDFKPLGTDNHTKVLVVALLLNLIMKQLNRVLPVANDVQPLQMILVIDEAHLLLPKEGKAGLLGQLARQGRSWGFPVWLASQDADKFVTSGDQGANFADLATCGIHFSPHLLNEKEQKSILGKTIGRQLETGETVLRLGGKTITGNARQYWREQGRNNLKTS